MPLGTTIGCGAGVGVGGLGLGGTGGVGGVTAWCSASSVFAFCASRLAASG